MLQTPIYRRRRRACARKKTGKHIWVPTCLCYKISQQNSEQHKLLSLFLPIVHQQSLPHSLQRPLTTTFRASLDMVSSPAKKSKKDAKKCKEKEQRHRHKLNASAQDKNNETSQPNHKHATATKKRKNSNDGLMEADRLSFDSSSSSSKDSDNSTSDETIVRPKKSKVQT